MAQRKRKTAVKQEKKIEDNGVRWVIVGESGHPVYVGNGFKDVEDGEKRANALASTLIQPCKVVRVTL